jgi:tRNA A37 threonylcarbamoyladenosine synthetase subunit TsaC/SUA5/YrdC
MRIELDPRHPEPRKIARAVQSLRSGECIAYPTDTVYGLGCAMSEKRAVDALYEMKRMRRSSRWRWWCPTSRASPASP